jgi:hypothetical protein
MARQAVETLAETAREHSGSCDELLDDLQAAGRRLAAARPGVGAIAGAVGRLLAAGQHESHLDPEEFRRML